MPPSRRAVLSAAAALPLAGRARAAPQPKAPAMPLPLVELRRYRTHPGMRDTLIELFEREFVESQEAVGMTIIGTFREPGQPDRFTWIRGFADMEARARGLNDFYFGPLWQAHREAANACLDDNDDVLLLREARPGSGFRPATSPRPPVGAPLVPRPPVAANIAWLASPADEALAAERFERHIRPRLADAGVPVLAAFVREKSANNFPRLKVREDQEVFVWFEGAGHTTPASLSDHTERLTLEPTARSLLQG